MGCEELRYFLISADGKGENAVWFDESTGSVDDVSSDCADMMERPELDSFEGSVSLFVGNGHLKLAA